MKKIQKYKEINEIKRDCYYYNWNDNENLKSNFKKYGAKCKYYDIFFKRNYCNMIEPFCYECNHYKKRED